MNPRPDDIDALARAIDRVVFAQAGGDGAPDPQSASLALISYLNDSFPRVTLASARRDRLQRRLIRALGIPAGPAPTGWVRLEALVLLGVLGLAVWRQRGAVKPAIAALR